MNYNEFIDVLSINPNNLHLNEKNVFVVHPKKVGFLKKLKGEVFDKAIVEGLTCEELTTGFFSSLRSVMKERGIVEIIVKQPISVMVELDAERVESLGRLAGFSSVQHVDYEYFTKVDGEEKRITTVKVSMIN